MEDSCESHVVRLQMCSQLEGVFVQDASDVDYMQNLSVVLEIVVRGDNDEVFA